MNSAALSAGSWGLYGYQGWGRSSLRSGEAFQPTRSYIRPEAFVVMPNHVHLLFAILWERNEAVFVCRGVACYARDQGRPEGPKAHSVGAIIRSFKSSVTKRARAELGPQGNVWHRGHYNTIIENDQQFLRALDYIAMGPERWMEDRHNPDRSRGA